MLLRRHRKPNEKVVSEKVQKAEVKPKRVPAKKTSTK